MSDSLSESDTQQVGQYSTPVGVDRPLSCSISSISGGRSSAVKKVLSRRRYNTDNQNEETDGVFGDNVREHAIIPEDIQSVDMQQLFFRADDAASQKTVSEPCSLIKVPVSSEVFLQHSSSDDDTFDGKIGEHHRTYSRIPLYQKRDSSEKKEFPICSTADLLWEHFVEQNNAFYSRKNTKPIKHLPIKSAPKFFKTRRQKDEVVRAPSKQNRAKASNISYSEMFMPSLKRPLGWMAIRGIGYAERLKVCNELIYFPEDMLESCETISKKRKYCKSIEYASPLRT